MIIPLRQTRAQQVIWQNEKQGEENFSPDIDESCNTIEARTSKKAIRKFKVPPCSVAQLIATLDQLIARNKTKMKRNSLNLHQRT